MGNRHNWERLHRGVSHKTWAEKRVADLRDKPRGGRTCPVCRDAECVHDDSLESLIPGFVFDETEREGG